MQPTHLLLPFNWLTRMLASVSVRTRIVLLALIPVAGFVANGFTYTSGEGDVGRTFDTFTRSAAVADASRDFKSAVSSMRIVVKDFSLNPSDGLWRISNTRTRSRSKIWIRSGLRLTKAMPKASPACAGT
jgi:methyl-accepting chemotaxis protein